MSDPGVGMTFHHEFIWEVHELGLSPQSPQVGDRVMVPFNVSCGTCYFCARGLYSNCPHVSATATGWVASTDTPILLRLRPGPGRGRQVPFADVRQGLISDGTDDDDAVVFTGAPSTGYFGGQLGDIVEGHRCRWGDSGRQGDQEPGSASLGGS